MEGIVHTGTYQAYEGAVKLIVLTPELATALDELILGVHEVFDGGLHWTDLSYHLDQVKKLHDFHRVNLGGSPVEGAVSSPAASAEG
jgi:hypothetical protein